MVISIQEDMENTKSSGPNGLKLLFTWVKEDIKKVDGLVFMPIT